MKLPRIVVDRLIDLAMVWFSYKYRHKLKTAFDDPAKEQERVLRKIIAQNSVTTFGTQHKFASIKDANGYRKHVPVQTFDSLSPSIDRQMAGETALTSQPPVFYAKTSGTTGSSKFIPVTQAGLDQMKMAQRFLSVSLWKSTGFFSGSILGMASPWMEGRLENGVAYGASSGSAYRSLSRLLRDKFVTPPQAFEISDVAAKYQVYALAALACSDISGIGTANPSSILKVCEIIESDQEVLLDALERRSVDRLLPGAAKTAAQIMRNLHPERVSDLIRARQTQGKLRPEQIWPKLSAIATWTGGSCGIAIRKLRSKLPAGIQIVEYGYAASEFVGTHNVDADANICMPLITEHFYEFVSRADWDQDRLDFVGIQDLIAGHEYYVFLTTQSGLYRYDINDLLLAGPGIGKCASLKFLQKGRGVTNITGEKLSEHQVIAAASQTFETLGLTANGFIFLADEEGSRYEFFVEANSGVDLNDIARITEHSLQDLNSEYADKRASGRLRSLVARRLNEGAINAFKDQSVARGVREAQYKPVALDYLKNWHEKIAPWVDQVEPRTQAGAAK